MMENPWVKWECAMSLGVGWVVACKQALFGGGEAASYGERSEHARNEKFLSLLTGPLMTSKESLLAG